MRLDKASSHVGIAGLAGSTHLARYAHYWADAATFSRFCPLVHYEWPQREAVRLTRLKGRPAGWVCDAQPSTKETAPASGLGTVCLLAILKDAGNAGPCHLFPGGA